jgi:hypothetical protein
MTETQRKYNIVFISPAQRRADCYGFEGRNARTPNFDEMSRNGIRWFFRHPVAPWQPLHGRSDDGSYRSPQHGGYPMYPRAAPQTNAAACQRTTTPP